MKTNTKQKSTYVGALFVLLLSLSLLSGCATTPGDYSSSFNTDTGIPGTIISGGKSGTKIDTGKNIYKGKMNFYEKESQVSYDKNDITNISKGPDGVLIKNFNDGTILLVFPSGKAAYGNVVITPK
jgi:hypothetical protein